MGAWKTRGIYQVSMDFQIDQINLIRGRLLRYRSIERHNGRMRPWDVILGDMILSGIEALAGKADGKGTISDEALRRFAKKEQTPSNDRLRGLAEFLIDKGHLTTEELSVCVLGPEKSLSFAQRIKIGRETAHFANLEGRWTCKSYDAGVQKNCKKLSIIRLNLSVVEYGKDFEVHVNEHVEEKEAISGKFLSSYMRSTGFIVPVLGNGFSILLFDKMTDEIIIYLSIIPIIGNGKYFSCIGSNLGIPNDFETMSVDDEREARYISKSALSFKKILDFSKDVL